MMQQEEMPESQLSSKCEGGRNHDCILQQRTETASIGNKPMKVESGVYLSPCQAELQFLRSRVRELEREKAKMAAENHRLKNMLVTEIPGLLSTMWQTLGQANQHSHAASPQAISTATGRVIDFSYPHHSSMAHSAPDGGFSPSGLHPPLSDHSAMGQEDLDGNMAEFGHEIAASEEDVTGGHLGLGDIGEEVPLCNPATMPDMRTCSETNCVSGNFHVNHVEVYPGSGVFCELRAWHAANQAQSPTAMARTLLLGIFDMETLMNSNLRGGRSRRPAYHQQRNALDPHKINAIFNATLARFPLARKGVIGTGINSKLSEIRFRSRRANREPRYL